MIEIRYEVGETTGTIGWAASEYFGELKGREFALGEMEAVQIETMENLTTTGKILLSAVAGAVIQYLIDTGVAPEKIFVEGKMEVL